MSLALADVLQGLFAWRLWGMLGWQDIVRRYRRSTLGPFWMTLTMAILIGSLGLLYGKLFRMKLDEYMPYLTLGFVFWALISAIILESCNVFMEAERLIKQLRLPISLYVYRVIWRCLIVFFHNFVVYIPVALIFKVVPSVYFFLIVPGLLLVALTGAWVGLLLGLFCTRFRDLPPLVGSVTQLIFFLTPILWPKAQLGSNGWLAELNPFYHYIELVRAPLLGYRPSHIDWAVAVAITGLGWLLALAVFGRFKRRIVYWL